MLNQVYDSTNAGTSLPYQKVRMVFKHVSKAGGVYRKRIASTGRAYMKHNEFCECVNHADVEKLAQMIKILSFLIQTKSTYSGRGHS